MTEKDAKLRVHDFLEAAKVLETSVLEAGVDAVFANTEKRWVMERGLEIISEASRHLPSDIKDAHPHIEWQSMADLGNRLRHGYNRLDSALLWQIVESDVPILEHRAENLKQIFAARML
jgi:uncharacterized protein with HEPN domain